MSDLIYQSDIFLWELKRRIKNSLLVRYYVNWLPASNHNNCAFTLKACLLKKKKSQIFKRIMPLTDIFNTHLHACTQKQTTTTTKNPTCIDSHNDETDLSLCLCHVFFGSRDSSCASYNPIQQYGGAIRWESNIYLTFFLMFIYLWIHIHTR